MALSGFGAHVEDVMNYLLRKLLIDDYCWLKTEPFHPVTDKTLADAEEWADKLIAEGTAMKYLEATAEKPCPTCGRVG